MINRHALRAIREKDGHTRTSLARAAGISPQLLTDIEEGRRTGRAHVPALARALDVPQSALTRAEDEEVPA